MIWELKREAEKDFDKFIRYVKKLEEDNKELRRCWSIEINTCNRYREKCNKLKEENKTQKEYYIIACEKVYKLEEENKRISKQRDNLSSVCDRVMEENDYLEQENKKLKAELEFYKKQYEHSMWEKIS